VLLLAVAAWWVYANLERLGNYVFGHIFVIMAMCAPLALWAAGRRRPTQLAACVLILIGYWAFFALFPLPPAGFNPASVGVSSTDEWLTGFFAHWNKNANAAFHFDLWFLNQLPRTEPYAFHGLGLQTLTFIPESVTMILGVIAGQVLLESPTRAAERRSLLGSGVASVALGIVAGGVACPIVKSIWTPSWVLLSGGLALLTLGALREACHTESPARLLWPVVALGSNAVLLYVLASAYRWRIVEGWHTVLPPDIFQSTRGSLHDALFVLLVLWIIALALSRMKVFVKL
jgi:predicted acyltransferase